MLLFLNWGVVNWISPVIQSSKGNVVEELCFRRTDTLMEDNIPEARFTMEPNFQKLPVPGRVIDKVCHSRNSVLLNRTPCRNLHLQNSRSRIIQKSLPNPEILLSESAPYIKCASLKWRDLWNVVRRKCHTFISGMVKSSLILALLRR